MADIHVFTDMDQIAQGATQSYGPVPQNEDSMFRTTAKFTWSSDAKAYAAFDGVLIIQNARQGGTNISGVVNLILKPLSTSSNGFSTIKYMIYRGLKWSEYFETVQGVTQIKAQNPGSDTDLLTKLWELQQLHVLKGLTTLTEPPLQALGYEPSRPDTELIDHYFREHSIGSTLFPVKMGWTIGTFDADYGGIDVVINEFKYYPTLGMARDVENIFTVTPNGSKGAESVDAMRKRENVLNFLDPAVFYNLQRELGVFYRDTGTVGTPQQINGDVIYEKVVSKFYSKNRIYIDLRNENDYSINFNQDNESAASSGLHCSVGVDTTSTTNVNYYPHYWPVYWVTPTSPSIDVTTIYLKFAKRFNPKPLIYTDYAMRDVFYPRFRPSMVAMLESDRQRFIDDNGTGTVWGDAFGFVAPNYKNPSTNAYFGSAWIMRLHVIRRELPAIALPERGIPKNDYLDFVFGPIGTPAPFDDPSAWAVTRWKGGLGKRYIRPRGKRPGAMVQTGVAISDTHVTYYAEALNYNEEPWQQEFRLKTAAKRLENEGLSMEGSILAARRLRSDLTDAYQSKLIELVGGHTSVTAIAERDTWSLTLSFDEHEHRILSVVNDLTKYDKGLHDIYFSIDILHKDLDGNATPYGYVSLTLAGLDSNGVYRNRAAENGSIYAYTVDAYTYTTANANPGDDFKTTSDPRAYISAVSSPKPNYVDLVRVMESVYKDLDPTPLQTLTRLRNQYYGIVPGTRSIFHPLNTKDAIAKCVAFIFSLPEAKHWEGDQTFPHVPLDDDWDFVSAAALAHNIGTQTYSHRILHSSFEVKSFSDTYYRSDYPDDVEILASKADENNIQDNPGPYLVDGAGNNIDLGHMLYGLESLRYGTRTHPFYQRNGVRNSIILASFVADIATPVARYYLTPSGKSDLAEVIRPDEPNLQRDYEISAPEPDLLGDADSFGMYEAWRVLSSNFTNNNVKLSDVLASYYSTSPTHAAEHYTKRWTLFAKANGFLSGTTWIPQPNHMDSVTVQLYTDVLDFANFWVNTCLASDAIKSQLIDKPGKREKLPNNKPVLSSANVYWVIDTFLAMVKQQWTAE